MKEFLENIIKHLVDYPDEVRVAEIIRESTIIYEVKVARSDIGKIIGRRGRIIDAIRVLLNAAGRKAGKHTILEIIK